MEIKMFKLITGDVIIGEVYPSQSEDSITLKNVVQAVLDSRNGGVGLLGYNSIYSQKPLTEIATFKNDHILETISVHESFFNAYKEQIENILSPKPEEVRKAEEPQVANTEIVK